MSLIGADENARLPLPLIDASLRGLGGLGDLLPPRQYPLAPAGHNGLVRDHLGNPKISIALPQDSSAKESKSNRKESKKIVSVVQ